MKIERMQMVKGHSNLPLESTFLLRLRAGHHGEDHVGGVYIKGMRSVCIVLGGLHRGEDLQINSFCGILVILFLLEAVQRRILQHKPPLLPPLQVSAYEKKNKIK